MMLFPIKVNLEYNKDMGTTFNSGSFNLLKSCLVIRWKTNEIFCLVLKLNIIQSFSFLVDPTHA
jgi:hypothetical protein